MTSKDGFRLAAEIARGEHDDEIPDYDVIVQWIRRCPQTWSGGLLRAIITKCVLGDPQFFKGDAALIRYVGKAVSACHDPNSMLRTPATQPGGRSEGA